MTFSEELIYILNRELEILMILKELTFNKTDIIINNEIEKLENIVKKEEELINKIAIVEEERVKLMDSWGVGTHISLSEVVQKVPEGKEDLASLKDRLYKSLEEIRSRNSINNQLINENLEWLDFNMNLLVNTSTPPTYSKEKKGAESKNSVFDRKV